MRFMRWISHLPKFSKQDQISRRPHVIVKKIRAEIRAETVQSISLEKPSLVNFVSHELSPRTIPFSQKDDRQFFGVGIFDQSHGCAKLHEDSNAPINETYFGEKIGKAKAWREYSSNFFRLINGGGDGIPGVFCDVVGDILVITFTTTAYDKHMRKDFVKAVSKEFSFTHIVIDSELASGQPALEKIPIDDENGSFVLALGCPIYHLRHHAITFAETVYESDVCDLYATYPAFSIYAKKFGARSVTAVSENLELLRDSATRNFGDIKFMEERVDEMLTDVQFDVVLLQAPSLIRAIDDMPWNSLQKAVRLVKPQGSLWISLTRQCPEEVILREIRDVLEDWVIVSVTPGITPEFPEVKDGFQEIQGFSCRLRRLL